MKKPLLSGAHISGHFQQLLSTDRRPMMANIVTAKQIAQYLKLTESTIYKLASTGELPGFRIGKSWRFDMDEILERIKDEKKTRAGQWTGPA
jgi:excisionase family DNA binding protein